MVVKQAVQEAEEFGSEVFDEGWWSSVLADEEAFGGGDILDTDSNAQQSTFEVDWGTVERVFSQDEIVKLTVHGYNRGGLLVQAAGIQGFVPTSHLTDMPASASDEERQRALAGYLGRQLALKVIECEPAQERVVLSERAALAGVGCRKELFKTLEVGALVYGVVTNITDFGAFIDLGGVEGLVHVSELSWGRVQHPSQVLKLGQKVGVLVMSLNEENNRIALSLKRLHENPWEVLAMRYHPGDVVEALITSTTRYGIFARLDEGVEGLIHISSLKSTDRDGDQRNNLVPGRRIPVRILHIDCERRRLGLGLVMVA